MAELKGRADSERENSQHLLNAARNGDAKAALAILQHSHGWVAKQAVSIEVDQRISVLDALKAAETRTIEGMVTEVLPAEQSATPLLRNRQQQEATQ
jgi:t-SNARE complex subunit (syntaxin)